jgi:hypothetical protein
MVRISSPEKTKEREYLDLAVGKDLKSEPIRPEGEVIPPEASRRLDAPPPRDSFWPALAIAIAADLLQIVVFPLFAEGVFSPLSDMLDVAMGLAMVRLVGWHWAFLPSFLGKLIPLFDEVPCWTLALLFVRAERAKLQSAS